MSEIETNLGYKAKTKIINWNEEHSNCSLCYSCGRKECNGFLLSFGDGRYPKVLARTDRLMKKHKTKIIYNCDGYQEQEFKISDEMIAKIKGLVEEFCYESCEGEHNISQGSESFFNMIHEVSLGIAYCLSHRKEFNLLGDKAKLWRNK